MTILRPERVWFSCLCLTMVSGANSSSLILPLPDHGVRRQLQLPDLASPPPLAEAGTVLLAVVPLLAPFPWFSHPGDLSGRCPCSVQLDLCLGLGVEIFIFRFWWSRLRQ